MKSGRKGASKRFIDKKYAGQVGWLDESCNHPRTQYYVCVFLSEGNEVWTRIRQEFLADLLHQPNNFAEAVINQHPDIENTMNTPCKM